MTELEKKAEEYAKSIFSTNDKDSAYYQQLMFTAYKDGYEQGQESMELRAQIEKMKCCGNCKNRVFVGGFDYFKCTTCCIDYDKWELEN